MTRLTRRGFTSGAIAIVGGAACGGLMDDDDRGEGQGNGRPPRQEPGAPPFEPGAPGSSPAGPPDPNLKFSPVQHETAPPRVLWSWTTEEQATELRRDGVLFTRESSPTLGRGYLFDVLDGRAAKGDAAAARLVGTELAKGRFAWSNPWATVRGATQGESYGLELLKIEMRADTLFARVRTSIDAIDFVDHDGRLVATATALASFDKVGGIVFENDAESLATCSTATGGGAMIYREIYLGNEPQVATFSHRTRDILDTLDAHVAELDALFRWLEMGGRQDWANATWGCLAGKMWRSAPKTSVERYLASLAFATPPYAPSEINMIVAELKKARFTPDPFTHGP